MKYQVDIIELGGDSDEGPRLLETYSVEADDAQGACKKGLDAFRAKYPKQETRYIRVWASLSQAHQT